MFQLLLSQTYLITAVVSLFIGLFVPQAHILVAINTFLLQIIFFLSCLKIEPKIVLSHLKDWKFLLVANLAMLVAFPFVVWILGLPWRSEFGFAIFLLAAMPVGMTAPLLVDIVGGKHSIAIVLTVTTSLLAPFTVPLLTKFLFGAQISVDALNMFKQLLVVIFIPFILAVIFRSIIPRTIDRFKNKTKPISTVLLGLLIIGAVSNQSSSILGLASNPSRFLLIIIGLYGFFLLLHLAGYFVFWWKPREDKQTASISLTYMNFTLAIFLASQFFHQPGILLTLVLSIIPWATFMPVWRRLSVKFK